MILGLRSKLTELRDAVEIMGALIMFDESGPKIRELIIELPEDISTDLASTILIDPPVQDEESFDYLLESAKWDKDWEEASKWDVV